MQEAKSGKKKSLSFSLQDLQGVKKKKKKDQVKLGGKFKLNNRRWLSSIHNYGPWQILAAYKSS